MKVWGCLPFTKTIQLEISGINMKQLNVIFYGSFYVCEIEIAMQLEK